ncbi:hypothetical protein NE237_027446 [Protea cynaroides]|uniref:Uncharacterized protein n=1 Tax=Protea cynaroides TaxID=273540 RepID=A0A9Q0JRX4_9MAGN|nr:hypothetical protein NE237_027446 [Protea cynaroides]
MEEEKRPTMEKSREIDHDVGESFGTKTDSFVPSESDNWSGFGFSRCPKCPFAEGAVSVDEAKLLLLEMLQNCVDSGIKEQNLIRSPNSCSHTVLPILEISVEIFSKSEENISETDSSGSSCLSKLLIDATFQSSSIVDDSLFHFSDILSLVELVACSMNWEWTIIPVLLKMLESSIPEKFSTAINVLLGQLGRRRGISSRLRFYIDQTAFMDLHWDVS